MLPGNFVWDLRDTERRCRVLDGASIARDFLHAVLTALQESGLLTAVPRYVDSIGACASSEFLNVGCWPL